MNLWLLLSLNIYRQPLRNNCKVFPLGSRIIVICISLSFKFIKFAGKSLYNNHLLQIAS